MMMKQRPIFILLLTWLVTLTDCTDGGVTQAATAATTNASSHDSAAFAAAASKSTYGEEQEQEQQGRCKDSNEFMCPNCEGIFVTDCLQCNGFLNAGEYRTLF